MSTKSISIGGLILGATCLCHGLVNEASQLARSRLMEALSSPSGKLTFSPEICVPEPSGPTEMLLQASAIRDMSGKLRLQSKANAVFLDGPLAALRSLCQEQEDARGNFPGPIPVIYCGSEENLELLADAGASGVVVKVNDGEEVASVDDVDAGSKNWVESCSKAVDCGLEPLLEVSLNKDSAKNWNEDAVASLVEKLVEAKGSEPVSVLLTVQTDIDDEAKDIDLPQVPASIGKTTPIIGSVKVKPAEGVFTEQAARYKEAGFTGALLRKECVPGYGSPQNMEFVARFWVACIGELKSTRSKNFGFRSKNNMEKNVATQWANLQADVMDSGALGDPNDSFTPDLDDSKGEYKGF